MQLRPALTRRPERRPRAPQKGPRQSRGRLLPGQPVSSRETPEPSSPSAALSAAMRTLRGLWVLPEGAALHVLAAQADVDALLQERAEGHVLRQCPVHGPVLHQLPTGLEDPAQPCAGAALTSCPLAARAAPPAALVSCPVLPDGAQPPRGSAGILTSVNGEVLHRHGAGHVPDVRQDVLRQARGWAGHAPRLPVQGEKA